MLQVIFLFQLSFVFLCFRFITMAKNNGKTKISWNKKITATHTLVLPFLGRATDFLGVPTGFVTPVELILSVDIVFAVRSVGGTVGVEEGTIKNIAKRCITLDYTTRLYRLVHPVNSEFRQQDRRKERQQNTCVRQTWQGCFLRVLTWSSLNLLCLCILQEDLFKGRWGLAEGLLKQNYCHACHTRFAPEGDQSGRGPNFFWPLKETMLRHRQYIYFYIFSRAILNETFTAKYDGLLPKTP